MNIKNKKIIVTGGSRGIGAAISKELAAKGAQVALTYSRSKDKAEDVVKSLAGEGHLCLQLDISSEESIETFFAEVKKEWGQIDGLVNNAGITQDQLLLRMKADDFDSVINTNLKGMFLCTKQAVKIMLKKKAGSIVSITSVIGQRGNAGQANYAASKAGIEAFTKSVAQEVGSRSIRLNCIAPGFIATDMTDIMDDNTKAQWLKNIPLNRLGQGKDIADTVAFLVSDESTYITGQTISVNGGLHM